MITAQTEAMVVCSFRARHTWLHLKVTDARRLIRFITPGAAITTMFALLQIDWICFNDYRHASITLDLNAR